MKFTDWKNPFRFKATVPTLSDYIGRTVNIPKVGAVKIDHICGNVGMTLGRAAKDVRPGFYEINGQHLIGMLRFHAQMTGARDITEQQFLDFENMEFDAEKLPEKKKEPMVKDDIWSGEIGDTFEFAPVVEPTVVEDTICGHCDDEVSEPDVSFTGDGGSSGGAGASDDFSPDKPEEELDQ